MWKAIKSSSCLNHIWIHTGINYYQCKECGKACTAFSKHTEHTEAHTVEKPFKCDTSLLSHVLLILSELTMERNFVVCVGKHLPVLTLSLAYLHWREMLWVKKCGKAFINASKVARPLRIHTGENPCKCKGCGKTFISSFSLSKHKTLHSGEVLWM